MRLASRIRPRRTRPWRELRSVVRVNDRASFRYLERGVETKRLWREFVVSPRELSGDIQGTDTAVARECLEIRIRLERPRPTHLSEPQRRRIFPAEVADMQVLANERPDTE